MHDVKALIQKILTHHQERMDRVLLSLSKGEKTPFEIAMDLFPGVPPFEVFLGISEAVGHLEILREKGMVRVKEKEGGRLLFIRDLKKTHHLNTIDSLILND